MSWNIHTCRVVWVPRCPPGLRCLYRLQPTLCSNRTFELSASKYLQARQLAIKNSSDASSAAMALRGAGSLAPSLPLISPAYHSILSETQCLGLLYSTPCNKSCCGSLRKPGPNSRYLAVGTEKLWSCTQHPVYLPQMKLSAELCRRRKLVRIAGRWSVWRCGCGG